jgi:LacI family transcriptional regulator, galactose operon repressor
VNPRRVTLDDVAQRAAVSIATVSRALSGDPQISKATQTRVRQVAAQLNYVPNVAARSLVLQSSATFGLMTPDVTDPIHGQVVTGFQQRAAERGYSVIIANGFWDADTERRALREFTAHRVAGLAIMGGVLPQTEVKRVVSPSPALFLGSEHVPPDGTNLDLPRGCLRPDDRDGMRQVVTHLLERGYHRVAYVSASSGANPAIRHDALVAALAEHGETKPVVYRADDASAASFRRVATQIAKHRPEVVVCYDDKTALEVIDELRTVSVRVPADVGFVGFDDIPFARTANPRLTTVAQPSEELGRLSVDILLSALEEGRLPRSRLMPVTLVVRETTPGPQTKRGRRGQTS